MTDGLLANWLILIAVMVTAVASPGPDFVLAVRTSLLHTRRAGIVTAAGFAAGVMVHVTAGMTGLGALITGSPTLFTLITYAGAGYLGWVGLKALFSKASPTPSAAQRQMDSERAQGQAASETQTVSDGQPPGAAQTLSDAKAFRQGFITNIFNPKAALFFIALFTQIIDTNTALATLILYAATCTGVTFLWFSFVAAVLTNPAVRRPFMRASTVIDRVTGILLIGLALRLVVYKPATA